MLVLVLVAQVALDEPDAADARTDIYALGAVAYHLLAGRNVFDGQSLVEVCAQHLHEDPKPFASRGVNVPPELEGIVLGCLRKDPKERPQTAGELRRQLQACGVTPWDDDTARAWWENHRAELDSHDTQSSALARTIAVGGSSRG